MNKEILKSHIYETCEAYDDKSNFIGIINNPTELLHFRVYIKENAIAGCSIKYNNKFYIMDKNGRFKIMLDIYDHDLDLLIKLI